MAQRVTGERLQCSFCGKSQHEVRKLIAGPDVYICDRCIELCNDILTEEWEEEQNAVAEHAAEEQPADAVTGPPLAGTAACSLCGVATAMGLLIAVRDRGHLCFACLDAIRDASEPSNGR